MSFTPSNAPVPTPLDLIISALTTDCTDPKALSQEELEVYRLQLASLKTLCGSKLAETSTKEHSYDDEKVAAYIDDILDDGFNLNETELSDYPEYVDAQHLKRWSSLIAERVEASVFGSKKFKIHALRFQRTAIATAKTLHALRKAVTMMISPLSLWRDHVALVEATSNKAAKQAQKDYDKYVDSLLLEIEDLNKLCAERKRVIDSMLTCYSEVDKDVALLRQCESAKKEHNLSDALVCELFKISRNKLNTLRKDIDLNASPVMLDDGNPIKGDPLTSLYWHYLNIDHINTMIATIAEEPNEAYLDGCDTETHCP